MNATPHPPAVSRGRPARHGFALVIVLVVLGLLAVIAVGYLSSMASERATASAFSNKTRAEQAAQAGVDEAVGMLRDYFKAFPDSATAWDTTQATCNYDSGHLAVKSEGTTLYFRAVPQGNDADTPDPAAGVADANSSHADFAGGNGPNNSNGASPILDARQTFVLPLVSGATAKGVANKGKGMPSMNLNPAAGPVNAVNLNALRYVGDTQGWLGTPPASIYTSPVYPNHPKPVTVPWVNITQKDPIPGSTTAPVVGRYAFWVEDESFRANLNYADLTQTPGRDRPDNTVNRAIDPTYEDLMGLLGFFNIPNGTPGLQMTTAQSLISARGTYPGTLFPESLAFAHGDGLGADAVNQLRYLTTSQSSALNLSRHGTQRLNINAVLSPTPAVAATDTGAIQTQIDKIVQTITFHAPNFGQRFYRKYWNGSPPVVQPIYLNDSQMVTAPHSLIYLNKVAANLRDSIDPDTLPTVIWGGTDPKSTPKGIVKTASHPTQAMNFNDGPNPVWAVGKDVAPFIHEAGAHFYGTYSPTSRIYTVNVDYFVEVWNMSTREVRGSTLNTDPDTIQRTTLGPNPYIRISNPPKWFADFRDPSTNKVTLDKTPLNNGGDGHTLGDTRDVPAPGRDYDFDLRNAVFPAGSITVLTTMPTTEADATNPYADYKSVVKNISGAAAADQTEVLKHYVSCPPLNNAKRTYTGTMPPGCNEVTMLYQDGNGSSDYETSIVIGSDNGYIDCLEGALSMNGGVISVPQGKSPKYIYGAYLRGNLAASNGSGLQPSAIGDPRSNNEQLTYTLHVSSGGSAVDETQYKNLGNGIEGTFGLPNYTSVDPGKVVNPWPDTYWFPHSVSGGPTGNGTASAVTMKAQHAAMVVANQPLVSIGQIGDVFDPARLPYGSGSDITLSRGGGRTFRVGQHDDRYDGVPFSNSSTWASWRLADMFSTSDTLEQPGLININGVARDKGAALLAALQGFKFQPQTDSAGTATSEIPMHGDYQLDGKAFDQDSVQRLVNNMISKRLTPSDAQGTDPTTVHPYFERGELSETPVLSFHPNTGTAADSGSLVSSVDMKTAVDHAQEELVRRLIDMTTTRGSVFTVYAMGQSVKQVPQGASTALVPTGTHQMRVTFKLLPRNADGSAFHPATNPDGTPAEFNPTTDTGASGGVYARFVKPDHYDVSVLSTSSGSS